MYLNWINTARFTILKTQTDNTLRGHRESNLGRTEQDRNLLDITLLGCKMAPSFETR